MSNTTAKELIEHLQNYYKPEDKVTAIFWGESDVRCCNKDDNGYNEEDAEFNGTRLTDDQVTEVLYSISHRHDANYGVNWDTIQTYVEMERDFQ